MARDLVGRLGPLVAPQPLLMKYLMAVVLSYVIIGFAYAAVTTAAFYGDNPSPSLAPPWSGPTAFVAWFLIPALLWPFNLEMYIGAPSVVGLLAVVLSAPLLLVRRVRRLLRERTS